MGSANITHLNDYHGETRIKAATNRVNGCIKEVFGQVPYVPHDVAEHVRQLTPAHHRIADWLAQYQLDVLWPGRFVIVSTLMLAVGAVLYYFNYSQATTVVSMGIKLLSITGVIWLLMWTIVPRGRFRKVDAIRHTQLWNQYIDRSCDEQFDLLLSRVRSDRQLSSPRLNIEVAEYRSEMGLIQLHWAPTKMVIVWLTFKVNETFGGEIKLPIIVRYEIN